MQQGVDRGMRISRLSADVDNMIASLEPPPPRGSVTLVAHGMSASVCHATIPEPDETFWSRLFLLGDSCPRHPPAGIFIPLHGLCPLVTFIPSPDAGVLPGPMWNRLEDRGP
jgi:hypothetical protein